MTYAKRGILTAYGKGVNHLKGGFRRGFSERWQRFQEDLDKMEKHEEDLTTEVLKAVSHPPEELGRKLGISAESAKKLKETVEFWHGRGLV